MTADTIYALSSGAGKSGIAVVRVSGQRAADLLNMMAGSLPMARRATVRVLRHPETAELLDKAVVLWLAGPATATGEDMAELHLHGSPAVVAAVLAAMGRVAGLRPAEPGEFARRGLVNQKIDLVEVEGLADLLAARTARQRQQALHHVLGEASGIYEDWRARLLRAMAGIEAAVDFVEEEGVAAAAMAEARPSIAMLSREMGDALAGAAVARSVRDGLKVVLAGFPNTGKSSLLNRLARREAAIVSAHPGTTRDVIEVAMDIGGMAVTLTDTAGLRAEAGDEIERIGMSRSRKEVAEAEIVVWVSADDVPGSGEIPADIRADVRVRNKCDRGSELLRNDSGINVSAATGDGIDTLIGILGQLIGARYGQVELPVIVRERQQQAITESIRHLNDSLRHDPRGLELVAEELRAAAVALSRVTGRIDVEDLLSSIFSEFCIGK